MLVSTAKFKDALGAQISEKFHKLYEAVVGSKTTETLIQSFLMLASKAIGMVFKVDEVEALQKEL